VVAFINIRGARASSDVQNWATAIKVAAIVAMTVVLLWLGRGHAPPASASMEFFSGPLPSGFLLAMVSVLWAYEGWQYSTFSAGETANPQRDFPRAYLLASLALICIYVLANFGYLAALGSAGAARSTSVASEAIGAVLGAGAGRIIAAAILVSIFSAANGTTLSATRVFYAMAEDGVFFRKLAEVHPRYRTPAVAIIAGLGWAMLLVATGTFEQLLTYVVFTGWAFYALGAACVFVYRRKFPDTPRPYRVPGYPLTPLLFIIPSSAIVINTIFAAPRQAAVGIVIVLAGAPAYFVWRRNARAKAARQSVAAE
jgi:APA family basic amino acid/polyamine antiporter